MLILLQVVSAAIELMGVAVAYLWASRTQSTPRTWRFLCRIGSRPGVAIAVCGGLALCLNLALLSRVTPTPKYHDEFSYLLAADTFAQGRLTNPTHPQWEHFESYHTIQSPSYASKFPPAQGLALAAGRVLFNREILGISLVNALTAGFICWMLQGWLPRGWSMLGGLFAVFHPTLQITWGQSFMGGSLAVLAAAMVIGALGRLRNRRAVSDALMLAGGVLLLANTRPYEGFLFVLPVAVVFAVLVVRRNGFTLSQTLVRTVAPAACLFAVGVGAMAYYNQQVTGSPWRLPYQVHESQYSVSPLFVWQSPKEAPGYRHHVMENFFTDAALIRYRQQTEWLSFLKTKSMMLFSNGLQLMRPSILLPLLVLPWVLRDRRFWTPASCALLLLLGSLGVCWMFPHYLAPALPALLLLSVQGLRRWHVARAKQSGSPVRGAFAVGLLAVYIGVFSTSFLLSAMRTDKGRWYVDRAELVESLKVSDAKHLVIVRYAPGHNPHEEWVYNQANIDASQVVWARYMGAAENRKLIDYFEDRTVWLLDADSRPRRLTEVPRPQRLEDAGELLSYQTSN